MSECLIFTLGKGSPTPESGVARYRTTRYRFSDGSLSEPDAFFGFQLYRWLYKTVTPSIDRVIILGTCASMWDALYEIDQITDDEVSLKAWESLAEAVTGGLVDADALVDIEQRLSHNYQVRVKCLLIPEGSDAEQQTQILSIISSEIEPRSGVHMCVTHGLRSLPILQFLSLNHLVPTLSIKIRGLYYGAFELRDAEACPVVKLDAAGEFLQWTRAIHIASQTGSLSGISSITALDLEVRRLAKTYEFALATTDVATAQRLGHLLGKRIRNSDLGAAGNLVKSELQRLLAWADYTQPAERLWELASVQLNMQNYRLAALSGQEAVILALAEISNDEYTYQQTAKGRDRLRQLDIDEDNQDHAVMKRFGELRNAMAHGTEPKNRLAAEAWRDPALIQQDLYRGLQAYRRIIFS